VIAIDTNVLVRLVVCDDPDQTRRARNLMKRGDVLVGSTVLLESGWILGSAYGLDRAKVSGAIRGVLGLEGVATDAPAAVAQALDWFDAGLDLADALHVASASGAGSFLTFDKRLLHKARQAGIEAVAPVPR